MNTCNFIEKAKLKHGNKYNYLEAKYVNSKTKIKIKCNTCNNIFEQIPSSHLSGSGCLPCSIILNKKTKTKTTEEFIEEAKKNMEINMIILFQNM